MRVRLMGSYLIPDKKKSLRLLCITLKVVDK